jgi:hypothetical protein
MAFAPSSAPIKTQSVQRAAQGDTEETIKDVATRFTENLLTYKYQTVDADFTQALRDATTQFATRPLGAFGGLSTADAKAQAKTNLSTSSVDVKGVAITSREKNDAATALVVMYRTYRGKKAVANASGLKVIELTLVNSPDGWKVDNAANPAEAN